MHVWRLFKAFTNGLAKVKLSTTQMHKIGRLLGTLLKTGLSLIGRINQLVKSALIPGFRINSSSSNRCSNS